jgi:asparaginyl-tRNA synthetase
MLIDPPILHEHIKNRKEMIAAYLDTMQYDLNMSNALYISVFSTIFGSVFSISPTFRQEKQSLNHLVEFRMLECESADSDFEQCIIFLQDYIVFILKIMAEQLSDGIFQERLVLLRDNLTFDTVTYKELVVGLQSRGVSIKNGDDISDRDIEASNILKNPTFVVDYPHPPATWTALPKDNTTYTFNFLLPDGFGELAEGGQRNNDYMFFQKKFKELKLDNLSWYAEAIRKNPCTRSGFGLGIERLISWLTGVHNISETVLFCRKGD